MQVIRQEALVKTTTKAATAAEGGGGAGVSDRCAQWRRSHTGGAGRGVMHRCEASGGGVKSMGWWVEGTVGLLADIKMTRHFHFTTPWVAEKCNAIPLLHTVH